MRLTADTTCSPLIPWSISMLAYANGIRQTTCWTLLELAVPTSDSLLESHLCRLFVVLI